MKNYMKQSFKNTINFTNAMFKLNYIVYSKTLMEITSFSYVTKREKDLCRTKNYVALSRNEIL